MEGIKKDAKWKLRFEIFWNNTPKKLRRTKYQINNIVSQAKIYTILYQ